jgi:hypothetical protein
MAVTGTRPRPDSEARSEDEFEDELKFIVTAGERAATLLVGRHRRPAGHGA